MKDFKFAYPQARGKSIQTIVKADSAEAGIVLATEFFRTWARENKKPLLLKRIFLVGSREAEA